MAEVNVWSRAYLSEQLKTALLNPIRAFRPRYLPLIDDQHPSESVHPSPHAYDSVRRSILA